MACLTELGGILCTQTDLFVEEWYAHCKLISVQLLGDSVRHLAGVGEPLECLLV